MRNDKQIFPFFDSANKPVSAAGTSASFHNNGYDAMTLEITGATAISGKIQGCVNIIKEDGTTKSDAECVWSDLALINEKDFTVKSNIESNGVYAVAIAGLARVRVVLESVSGNTTIVGVAGV